MDDKWDLFLKELQNLPINYSDPNWFQAYSLLQKKIKLDETLNYNRAEIYNGAFHFALNVQILSDDTKKSFIPFVFVLNSDNEKCTTAKKWADDSVDNKSVNYNYTDFFSDVRELINKNRDNISGLAEGDDISEIAFNTSYSQTDEKFIIKEISLNAGNRGESGGIKITSEEILKVIEELISKQDEQDFITQLSKLYIDGMGISKLHFAIYGLDGDYKSGQRLTHFFIAAENPNEIKDFFFGYVRKIRDIASCIRTRYTYDLIQKNKCESVKSAISAIMSRNMSHNLGSHYLYYTKKHLERLATELSIEQSPDIRGAALVLEYTQGRMDYLATIISNDKYPYGSVNFKSQIFDMLTIDDFSKRHFRGTKDRKVNRTVNYLLSNLIRSEDFTRPDIMMDGDLNPEKLDLLKLQVRYSEDGIHYTRFTGTNFMIDEEDDPDDFIGIPTVDSEASIKNVLSNIYIALPGGNMSCHAFFNVLENFIRNSAKYMREDFHRSNDKSEKILTTNIALKYKDHEHRYIDIIIYDDKENGTFYKLLQRTQTLDKRIQNSSPSFMSFFDGEPNIEYIHSIGQTIMKQIEESNIADKEQLLGETKSIVRGWEKGCLFEQICKRLSSIRILDENATLDKENKGLKEMIFSSAWMRSYSFPQGKSYTDIIFDIQNETDPDKKLKLIQKYCFSPVLVLEDGDILSVTLENVPENYFEPACFGLSLTLPIFRKVTELDIDSDESSMIQKCLTTYSDIILADLSKESPINLKKVFPRIYPIGQHSEKSEAQIIFREILRQRFPRFDDYWLSFGTKNERCGIQDDAHHIKFDHHMKDHVANKGGLEGERKYAYSDSVSGGNFTKTMNELFDAGFENGKYHSIDDEFFALKIKESALTRVTIIDERLSDSMIKSGTRLELSLKNIRLLNYQDTDTISSFIDLFKGNSFRDEKDYTHFLSIHLGLVEKIIQSTEFANFVGNISMDKRAEKFMSLLRECFGGENVFISIHSGRGNFSAELEGPLAGYPFISMSSLESAFNNSKFLLTQLLYNTAYIGKGRINNH